jgi:acyl carrier protein
MQENQDTYNKIVAVVTEILHIDKSAISPESSLESLGADSLDMLEIVMKLEETFDVEISDGKADHIVTIADAVKEIDALKKK